MSTRCTAVLLITIMLLAETAGTLLSFPQEAHALAAISKPPNNLGLVGYWSFNEATSTIATDFSGNDNHGTLRNTPAWTNGKRGSAVLADSSQSEDVLIPYSPELALTSFTVTAWFKADSFPVGSAYMTIVDKGDAGSNYGLAISPDEGSGNLISSYFGSLTKLATGPVLSLSTWYHFAVTYDTVSGQTNLYVDGVERYSATHPAPTAGTADVTIGSYAGASEFADGTIDEVRIYNRALSATEIAALYGSGAIRLAANSKTLTQGSTLATGLMGHWSFDGGDVNWTSGTAGTITDASGNGNTGTMTNMTRSAATAIGKLGQAFLFDNTNDYIQVSHSSSLNLTTELTISAWIKKNSLSGDDDIIIKGNAGLFNAQYGLETSGDEIAMYFESGGTQFQRTTDANLVVNTWYHIVLTYDDAGNAINFYVDGVLKNDSAAFGLPETASLIADTEDVFIGEFANGEELDGTLDDVRIYNRVLTQAEITKLYNLGKAVITP